MIEIAISLAIIGIALVGIIGVLPLGLNTQRDNREKTIIDQDGTVFMEAIRNGQKGSDDLTNYVYAIVNTGSNPVGYTNALAAQMGFSTANYPSVTTWLPSLTDGSNIVGLLSTPEFVYTDVNGNPKSVPNINFGGVSNHIYALVRSMSGPASEKPPQDNAIIQHDSFGYRIYCVNVNSAVDTNLLYLHPQWSSATSYQSGDVIFGMTGTIGRRESHPNRRCRTAHRHFRLMARRSYQNHTIFPVKYILLMESDN